MAEANAVVEVIVTGTTQKRTHYTSFTDKDRAVICRHVTGNRNVYALKEIQRHFSDLGKSTIRFFKRKYLEAIK